MGLWNCVLNDGAGHLTPADGGDFEAAQGKVVFLDADRDGDTNMSQKTGCTNEVFYETGCGNEPVIGPQELYPNGDPLIGWDRLHVTESLIKIKRRSLTMCWTPRPANRSPASLACGPTRLGRSAWRAWMRPGSGPSSSGPI